MIDTQQPFNISNITVSPQTDEMSCGGKTIEIKSMTMKMICYFANHNNEVVTREQLRENIWSNANATDHTINNHMYTLRQVFASFNEELKYFHTVTGSEGGYRLIAEVSQIPVAELRKEESISNASSVTPYDLNGKNKPTSHLITKPFITKYYLHIIIIFLISASFYWYFFSLLNLKEESLTPLTSMVGREQNPNISQDGTILLFANRTQRESTWELYASRLSSSSQILETKKVFSEHSRNENYVSISPNKKHIAFIRYPKNQRGIYLADFNANTLSATNTRLIIPLDTANLSPTISWLSNTQFFYTSTIAVSAPRKIFKFDITSNRSEPISAPPLNTYGDFAAIVSPNKKWLAVMRSDEALGYQLFLYDLIKQSLVATPVINNKDRRYVSFSDNGESVYFINDNGNLSEYNIEQETISVKSNLADVGYWPVKIPGKDQFITQQDWGLSSSTNRIIRINNPKTGGDGSREIVVENGLSVRSLAGIGDKGLIFASVTANQNIELWKYHQGKSVKLEHYNNLAHQYAYLSLHWLTGSNKAILSINNTCHIIDINSGKDSPLCPANETLYAGRFSKDGKLIYFVDDSTSKAVSMGLSGYPVTPMDNINRINSIHEGQAGDFYYSNEPTFDIYHFDAKTGQSTKRIERTYVIESFSNNDFVVVDAGIYFMDRKSIRNNAIYFYDFEKQKTSYIVASKDNYPHVVISDDEKFIYLIESYDNDSALSLVDINR